MVLPLTEGVVLNNANNLQQKAHSLRVLLERYAVTDSDVKEVYERIGTFLDKVDAGQVSKPTKFEYGWLFFRGDNNLLAYLDLCEAAAEFANELESENK